MSPPKSPASPRRAGRSEVTAKMQLEAEADRLLMMKQVSKQVCSLSQWALLSSPQICTYAAARAMHHPAGSAVRSLAMASTTV